MERLTGLADQLLSQGNMEVYQMTHEAVSHQVTGHTRWSLANAEVTGLSTGHC